MKLEILSVEQLEVHKHHPILGEVFRDVSQVNPMPYGGPILWGGDYGSKDWDGGDWSGGDWSGGDWGGGDWSGDY